MAYEWVGYATTGVVAVVGIWGTLHATTTQIDGQKEIARDERREKRLEASYLDLLPRVGAADDWVYQLFLHWSERTDPDNSPLNYSLAPEIFVNTLEGTRRPQRLLVPRVTQLIDELTARLEAVRELWLLSQGARAELAGGQTPKWDIVDAIGRLVTQKEAITELDQAIRDQVAAEVNHRHDGNAFP